MSVQEIILPVESKDSLISARTLGTIGMICSPLLYFASLLSPQNLDAPNPNQIYASLCAILYLFGAMATVTAMRNLRVTGSGAGAAILYVIQITGLSLAMLFDVMESTAPGLKQTTLFFVADMAYPFSHLMFIVLGIAVVKAGVWRGWRRAPAFLVGLALPLFFSLLALFGRENANFIFPVLVTAGFFLLGYAVRTTKSIVRYGK